MASLDQHARYTLNRILGVSDFADYGLEYLKHRDEHVQLLGYRDPGAIGVTTLALSGPAADELRVESDRTSVDDEGHILQTSGLTFTDNVDFENTVAIDYDVALQYGETPGGVEVNPRTGNVDYLRVQEVIGNVGEPDSVTDQGTTIKLVVDAITEAGVSNAGRTVRVWLDLAKSAVAVDAIQDLTVQWDGSNNYVVTNNVMGQATVSTTTTDYNACLMGPLVKRNTPLVGVSGMFFVGTVTGAGSGNPPTAFDVSGQFVYIGSIGDLSQVLRIASNGRLKVEVKAIAGETDELQISVKDSADAVKFSVDEDGDVVIEGDLTVKGTTTQEDVVEVQSHHTITDNLTAGDSEDDTHKIKGSWIHYNEAETAIFFNVDGITGGVGIGCVCSSGKALTVNGDTEVRGDILPDVTDTEDIGSVSLRFAELHVKDGYFQTFNFTGDFLPGVDDTQDLGSPSFRWAESHNMDGIFYTSCTADADDGATLGAGAVRWSDMYAVDAWAEKLQFWNASAVGFSLSHRYTDDALLFSDKGGTARAYMYDGGGLAIGVDTLNGGVLRVNGEQVFSNNVGITWRNSTGTGNECRVWSDATEILNFQTGGGDHFRWHNGAGALAMELDPPESTLRVRGIDVIGNPALRLEEVGGTNYWELEHNVTGSGELLIRYGASGFIAIPNSGVSNNGLNHYRVQTGTAPGGEGYGIRSDYTCNFTGTASFLQGLRLNSVFDGSGSTTGLPTGILNWLGIGSGLTVNNTVSVYWGRMDNAGLVSNYTGLLLKAPSGSGTIGNNSFQIYLEPVTMSVSGDNYGLYQEPTAGMKNYFGSPIITGNTTDLSGNARIQANTTSSSFDGTIRALYTPAGYAIDLSVNASGAQIYGRGGADMEINVVTSNELSLRTAGTERFRLSPTGQLSSGNEGAPDVDVGGLCLNHGSNDGNVFTLKNSDVAHGMTALAETDTYGRFYKLLAGTGAMAMSGYSDAGNTIALYVEGNAGSASGNTGDGPITFNGRVANGTTIQSVAGGDNIMTVNNNGTQTARFKGNGDMDIAGLYLKTMDDEKDAVACMDLSYVLTQNFDRVLEYNRDRFTKLGVLSSDGFVSLKGMWQLQLGAIGELYQILDVVCSKLGLTYEELRQQVRAA